MAAIPELMIPSEAEAKQQREDAMKAMRSAPTYDDEQDVTLEDRMFRYHKGTKSITPDQLKLYTDIRQVSMDGVVKMANRIKQHGWASQSYVIVVELKDKTSDGRPMYGVIDGWHRKSAVDYLLENGTFTFPHFCIYPKPYHTEL